MELRGHRRWLVLCFFLLLPDGVSEIWAEDWPWWRGPLLDGTSTETKVPLYWNAQSNVVWKMRLPGTGHASPIVYRDQIFLTAADVNSQERQLLSLAFATGEILWRSTVLTAPMERKHSLNSFASSTPATDGKAVYVAFLDRDQMHVAAYDLKGGLLWAVKPGPFASMHGFCSSPLLYKDLVIVNGDHDGDSYLLALQRKDGTMAWKVPRANHTRSYCAPLLRKIQGEEQMILSGDKCVASYDPATGKQHWVIDGPTEQFVASPVYSARTGLVYITGGFPEHHILAIRPDGTGNVTQTHIAWRTTEGAAYVPSPIVVGDWFFVVADSGVAHCFDASTGKIMWRQRLGEQHASIVSAEGRLYFLNDKGVMNVVNAGPEFILLARNDVGEKCFASPAISQGQIFLRGDEHLFRIGNAVH